MRHRRTKEQVGPGLRDETRAESGGARTMKEKMTSRFTGRVAEAAMRGVHQMEPKEVGSVWKVTGNKAARGLTCGREKLGL